MENESSIPKELQEKLTKDELISIIDHQIISIERLPKDAMFTPMTNADMIGVLYLIKATLLTE